MINHMLGRDPLAAAPHHYHLNKFAAVDRGRAHECAPDGAINHMAPQRLGFS